MKSYRNFFILVAIVIIALAAYFYYGNFSSDTSGIFRNTYNGALQSYYDGDNQKAITEIEKNLKYALTKEEEAMAKITLAFAYIRTGDYKKGTDVFKEVAANGEYSLYQRAQAVTNMADLFMLGSRRDDDLKEAIFSGNPYAGFVSTSTLAAAKQLYDLASDLYVLPFSEYRIAEWYAKQAMMMKLYDFKPSRTYEYYVSTAKEHIEKGDDAMADFSQKGNDTEIGYANWVKGATLAALWEAEKNDSYKSGADETFKLALQDLRNSTERGSYKISQELWASFYYASFLSRAYGKEMADEIKNLTALIRKKSEQNWGLIIYLDKLSTRKPADVIARYDYENALALAKIDPGFKELLRKLGWQF